MNVSKSDVIGRGGVLRREGVQRTDVNLAHRVTFAGADGGQMPGSDDGQRRVAAQRAGIHVLLLIIIGDRL
ncbi:hypothetical protein D3C86_1979660 [compost metagenome]